MLCVKYPLCHISQHEGYVTYDTLACQTASPVKHLQHDPLVDGKLGNDVCQEQVPVVLGSRVHALLREETRPGKGHESAELGALALVVGVVDVRGGMLDEEGRELQQEDAH
jgi:hypothetical protein